MKNKIILNIIMGAILLGSLPLLSQPVKNESKHNQTFWNPKIIALVSGGTAISAIIIAIAGYSIRKHLKKNRSVISQRYDVLPEPELIEQHMTREELHGRLAENEIVNDIMNDIDAVDDLNKTALQHAVYDGKIELVKELVFYGASTYVNGINVLHRAVQKGYVNIFKYLLEFSDANPNNVDDGFKNNVYELIAKIKIGEQLVVFKDMDLTMNRMEQLLKEWEQRNQRNIDDKTFDFSDLHRSDSRGHKSANTLTSQNVS